METADYIYLRSIRPPLPAHKHELKATLASDPQTLVGYILWEESPDRTSTLGFPTPEEEEEERREKGREKSEREREIETQVDLEFGRECLRLMGEARREVMRGRKHWYVVSTISLSYHTLREAVTGEG